MDTKLLEDFVCLARLENFTSASLERNITQSALSRRIKALEVWLGAKLINRDSKNFNLTTEGKVFIAEAEVIVRQLTNAREAVSTMQQKQELEIAVAAQNSIAQTLFLEWAKRLELKFENIYIRLLSEKLADCVELFSQAKADYLFCYDHEALTLPIDESKFSGTTIGREYLVPVCIPDQNNQPLYALPGSPTQALPYVAYAHDSLFGKAVDQLILGNSTTCFLQRRFENAYSHTLKSMALQGLGLAWLPESAILHDLQEGSLCRAGDAHWNIGFDVKLFYRHAPTSSTELAILETSLEMAAQNQVTSGLSTRNKSEYC